MWLRFVASYLNKKIGFGGKHRFVQKVMRQSITVLRGCDCENNYPKPNMMCALLENVILENAVFDFLNGRFTVE